MYTKGIEAIGGLIMTIGVSIILGKMLGVIFLGVGIGVFINARLYMGMVNELKNTVALRYLGGVIAMILGAMVISVHNIWELSWVVVITIVGWLMLIKGIAYVVFPSAMARLLDMYSKNKSGVKIRINASISVILGVILLYISCQR